MKIRGVFLILFGIWLGDFLSTVLILNLINGVVEINPLANSLFSLGWYGYLMMVGLAISVLLFASWLVVKQFNRISKKHNRKWAMAWAMIPIGFFYFIEVFSIINNLLQLWIRVSV